MQASQGGAMIHEVGKGVKIPVLDMETGRADRHAYVDPENAADVKNFVWRYDQKTRCAFRDRDRKTEGGGRELLQRRVMGCKTYDGSIVVFKNDSSRLDYRISS